MWNTNLLFKLSLFKGKGGAVIFGSNRMAFILVINEAMMGTVNVK